MLNEIDLSRVDLNLLVLFEVVLAERHVGRAAERLSLSPSAVSHGLGRLRRLLNDPLFLRTPKGVVPTARATELAQPVADLLARARSVIATARPFDPASSRRRFTIGVAEAGVFLASFLSDIRSTAPGIDIGILPQLRDTAVADLDARLVDIAVVPLDDIPARLVARALYEDELVIAARAGHPFLAAPTLERYCQMQHLVMSLTGATRAYVDEVLAERGLARRVAVAVPSFMLALAVIAETDLIAALPSRLVAMHGARFGVAGTAAPLPLRRFQVRAITPRVALTDAGLAWLFDLLCGGQGPAARCGRPGTEG